jgi:tRNA(Ile)-lysidine synthase
VSSSKAENIPRLEPTPDEWPGSGGIVVAFSGGPDSACLLHLLSQSQPRRRITAVHINHDLDHGSAGRAEQAAAIAEGMDVRCLVEQVQVKRSGSIEANARKARYRALSQHVSDGDVLVTAHHADDVAETLLLRLLRGSGVGGLGGIPWQRPFERGHLIRPLLRFRRSEIETYLTTHGIPSIHDPANDLLSLDRNFLRHEVLPLLKERFPGYIQAFNRSARLNRAAADVLRTVTSARIEDAERPGPRLDLSALGKQSPFTLAETIRDWCLKHRIEPPPGQQLDEFVSQVRDAPLDRQPKLEWGQVRVQRHGDSLWLIERQIESAHWRLEWDGQGTLELPADCGTLAFSKPLPDAFLAKKLLVCSGKPAEKLRIHIDSGHRSVKQLLAEAGIPPWHRQLWPRVWIDGELVALGDRWLDSQFREKLMGAGTNLHWTSQLNLRVE